MTARAGIVIALLLSVAPLVAALPDCHGAELVKADLAGAGLVMADLSGAFAELNGANFAGADLSGATLYGADLSGVSLGPVGPMNAPAQRTADRGTLQCSDVALRSSANQRSHHRRSAGGGSSKSGVNGTGRRASISPTRSRVPHEHRKAWRRSRGSRGAPPHTGHASRGGGSPARGSRHQVLTVRYRAASRSE